MQKSLTGKIEGVNSLVLLTVETGQTVTEACVALTNKSSDVQGVDIYHVRTVTNGGTMTDQETKIAATSLDDSESATLILEGIVFQAGDKIKAEVSGGATANIDINYVLSFTQESAADPDSPTNAALDRITAALNTHLSTGDANTNFGAAILGVRNQSLSAAQRLVHIKNALEAMRDDVSIKTAVEGVGTDLDELTTKLGEVLGADSDVVAQLTLAAASADLLTKLGELKTAVDGFEPVRVVLPPAVAGANLEADAVTADTALTDVYQDVASVEITPQSDVADMRIWLTLFWQGRMTYRVVRGTDEVVSEQSLDSTSGTLPVSYPVAHSPASTAAQTYKLQAKLAQAGTSASAKAGTTLYVEEIYGG